jgi:signal transduction histidine kinase
LTRSIPFRYGLATVCAAAGLLVASWMQGLLPDTTVFLAAVVIASWFGGLAPGLLAALLATVAVDYFFTPPLYSLDLSRKDVSGLIVFLASAALVGWASAGRRRSQDLLEHAKELTEAEVRARTADLHLTNAQLQEEITQRKRAQLEIEDLAGRLIHAQEEERSRIGRELHDHISQRLGLLSIKIDQLRMTPEIPQDAGRALDEVREQTSEITKDVHGLSHRLHSTMLDYLGLVPALHRLTGEVSARHGITIDFHASPLPAPLSSDISLCLFRIVEECLNNVAKHSGARSARVELEAVADGVRLTVADSGRGFDTRLVEGSAALGSASGYWGPNYGAPVARGSKVGLGFVSMRERLRLVRGTIQVQSAPAQGTRIEAWVPVAAA